MFDSKLAHSIQQDYQRAAEAHRLAKANKPETGGRSSTMMAALVGSILTILLLIF